MTAQFLPKRTWMFVTALSLALIPGCGKDDAASVPDPGPGIEPEPNPGPAELTIEFRPSFTVPGNPGSNPYRETGVFAFETGNKEWDETALPAFMCNLLLGNREGKWTYEPVENWPESTDDKISFFAYAPYAAGDNGISVSDETHPGAPVLKYKMPSSVDCHTDIYIAAPKMNLTRSTEPVGLNLRSVMAKIGFSIRGHGEKVSKIAIKGIMDEGEIALNAEDQGASTWNHGPAISTTEYKAALAYDEGKDYVTASETMLDVTAENGHIYVIPQNITYNARIVVTINGEDKGFPLEDVYQWMPGQEYNYNLTIPDSQALDYTDNNSAAFLIAPLDGSIDIASWQEAMDGCPEGYRLPTQNEGMLILLYKDGIEDNSFRFASYWSSTEYKENDSEAMF